MVDEKKHTSGVAFRLNVYSFCSTFFETLHQLYPLQRVRQSDGGGSLVKDQLNCSQNSSTSVKLIEKPFITGCLSDMLAVCHLSPECPYYL